MKELEIETMEVECQLVSHHETDEEAVSPAVWGGTGLTTSAIWGGHLSQWDSPVAAEKFPVSRATVV